MQRRHRPRDERPSVIPNRRRREQRQNITRWAIALTLTFAILATTMFTTILNTMPVTLATVPASAKGAR